MTALNLAGILLGATGVAMFAIAFVLLIEVLAAWRRPRQVPSPAPLQRPRLAAIVPAHNEAAGIDATVRAIRSDLRGVDRLVVVADNCSDDTRQIATDAGAEVISRDDANRRGKGFAMDFGVRHLAVEPPEVVIFIDADCLPDADSLSRIATLAIARMKPVQALYEMTLPLDEKSLSMQIAAFAWLIKNYIRPLGMHRLGLPCQLMGTGMAFPWSVVSRARLATDEIVEDLLLGLTLADDGHAPLFCPEARVRSKFPISREGQASQRARWNTGHLTTIIRLLPSLFMKALGTRNVPLLSLVLDASIPPLAFLALLLGAFLISTLVLLAAGGSTIPFTLALASVICVALSVLCAWWQVGRGVIPFANLAFAPAYAIQRLALYGRIFMGRKLEWVRTKRE